MRQFLTALVLLSTLAMAQSVVVAAPLSSAAELAEGAPSISSDISSSDDRFVTSAALVAGEVPEPATMVLLVIGLSGLAAVGGRTPERKNSPST